MSDGGERTSARIRRAIEVFEHARELVGDAREVYLKVTCAGDSPLRSHVDAMLELGDAPESADEPVPPPASTPTSSVDALDDPSESQILPLGKRRIGSYSILGILGRGGMGEVFRARQVSPDREVALKVLLPGGASENAMRRFDLEARVLARLQHPAIAHVYEAGMHEGWPYFAMELVRGAPPTEYAQRVRLDMRGRLELFLRICDGVHHAHLRGVIHRDLKPGNILVDRQGQPKILDFGVARANDVDLQPTEAHTSEGQILGTLPYMSPEQASGRVDDVDARTDVYALGVILYELLLKRHPIDLDGKLIPVAVQHIQVKEPDRPGSIDARLRGDVETIMLTALAKERDRRYQSVYDLSADIRRYMRDEPITARAPSAFYHWGKFARRNRTLVGAALLLLASLAGGTVTSMYLYVRAEDARRAEVAETQNARKALAKAQAASESSMAAYGFLSASLRAMFTEGSVPPPSLRNFLESAQQRVSLDLADHPLVEAGLRLTIGTAYLEFGNVAAAREQTELGLRRLREAPELDRQMEVSLLGSLAHIAATEESDDEAAALFAQALATASELGEAALAARVRLLVAAAANDVDRGETELAAQRTMQALELASSLAATDRDAYLRVVLQVGNLFWNEGRLVEAEARLREARDLSLDLYGRDHRTTANCTRDLGQFLLEEGDKEEAGRLIREFVDVRRRIFGEGHSEYAQALLHLADLEGEEGKAEESIHTSYEAIRIRITNGEAETGEMARTLNNLAGEYWRQGELEHAKDALGESLRIHRKIHGDDHLEVASGTANLGILQHALGEHEAAERSFLDAIALQRRHTPGDHQLLMRWLSTLGLVLTRQERFDEAEPVLIESLEMCDRLYPTGHPARGETRQAMGSFMLESGRDADAEPYLLEAYGTLSAALGDEDRKTQVVIANLVELYRRTEREGERAGWEARLLATDPADE